jgi:hypothetical protein
MLKIDIKTVDKKVYKPHQEAEEYKKALVKFQEALKTGDPIKIDDCVTDIETVTAEITYKNAFHDGMRFILNAMAGKEVIEL